MADCCGGGTTLIYPCSGASDVGEITDRAARRLWTEGFATKTCLAAIGAGLPGFIASAKGAEVNIAIDGCALACAKKSLERAGITPMSFLLSEMGLEKGKSPVTADTINLVCGVIREKSGVQTDPSAGEGCGCS